MPRYFKQTINTTGGLGMQDINGAGFIAQQYVQRWYHPLAIDDNYVLTTTALPTAAAGTTIAAASLTHATLDFERNLTVVASAAATSVVTIVGEDYDGNTVTWAATLTGTDTVTGTKMFYKITSVHLATRIDGAANIIIGIGNKLGLRRAPIAFLPEGLVDNVLEGTVPTLDLTNGSIAFNTALADTKVYIAKYWSSEII